MYIFTRTALILVAIAFLGCGGGGGGNGSASSGCSVLDAKIFGGESCDQTSRSPVVLIVAVGQQNGQTFPLYSCTGALVTLDDVVTSAHCFTIADSIAQQHGLTIVGFGAGVGGLDGEVRLFTRVALHPQYDGAAGSPFDIAMATLDRVPQPPIGPLPLLVSEPAGPGSRITAFGYGTNMQGEAGELRAADFTVTGLQSGNLIVVGDGANSICPGDSGGPAIYRSRRGVAAIAGVNSFTLSQCIQSAATGFGFVNIQSEAVIKFLTAYAPDIAVE